MPQVFDNALPTPGLQAHVAISRFVDHIPYYRQETFVRACCTPTRRRSRCWTPGRARRRRLTCRPMREGSTTPTPAWRSTSVWAKRKHATEFLKGWRGTLVVDAYAGYDKALSLEGRSTAYCMPHSRRKFDELVASSLVAAEAIRRIAWLYKIEAAARPLSADERLQMRLERSEPLWKELHLWLRLERSRVPGGAGIAKAIDYSLKHWDGLGR